MRASKNAQFNAEDLLDSLQRLEKENRFLRSELDNRFDTEKHQMQAQLQDALRDKTRLEEGRLEMEERVGMLQKSLQELSMQQENGVGISNQAQAARLAELQGEVAKIVKERDEYLRDKVRLEISEGNLSKQAAQLQSELSTQTPQLQKLLQEKSDLQSQLMAAKDRMISLQQDLVRLEAEASI